MAQSHPISPAHMGLTVSRDRAARTVFVAPVNRLGGEVDLLYIDVSETRTSGAMLAFVEAISRQIAVVQRNLLLEELEAKERALRETNRALREQDRIKDEYVFRITHDIKGHLGAIKSCLEVADTGSGLGSPEERAAFVVRASNRTSQLLEFITDLLQLTKLRLGGASGEGPFPLATTLAQALETVSPTAKEKQIVLSSEVSSSVGHVIGDPLSMLEVVTNLLFNALKYTPEGGSVLLRASRSGDRAIVVVRDTGIGIPPDEVGKVFDEFFRASNASAFAKEGTGLGLALVKEIVERHGGAVSAENNAERGASFTVTMRTAERPS